VGMLMKKKGVKILVAQASKKKKQKGQYYASIK
jgi:hypothetical protein